MLPSKSVATSLTIAKKKITTEYVAEECQFFLTNHASCRLTLNNAPNIYAVTPLKKKNL